VLRSRVALADASERFALHGIAGPDVQRVADTLFGRKADADHEILARDGRMLARVSSLRALLISPRAASPAVEEMIDGAPMAAEEWARMDIEDGVPWITPDTEDRFVPQMVNLDALGGVSFSKGCYPGQEIVARTHYLGRLKQRMYWVRIAAGSTAARVGDPLFSARFGAEQACGTLLNVAPGVRGACEALAVMQTDSAREGVHWRSLEGPRVDFLPLPYSLADR
jgi:folate-binding protein YgfZ